MTIRLLSRVLLGAGTLLVLAGNAQAGTQYLVNQHEGAASITGYITTNGSVGNIGSGDMLDWNLVLNDGISSFTLTHGNSLIYGPSSWIASSTDLSFDFSGTGKMALFQNPYVGSGQNYWCLDSASGGCGGASSASDWKVNGALIVHQYTGVQSIAHAVPEPSTYAMLGAGLGLIGFAARRRKQA